MAARYRQEVLNVLLAQLLSERGVISAPESIYRVGSDKKRRMPDVIVSFRGLRTAIEGEFEEGKKAQQKAIDSARSRVVDNIAHIGIGIVYPRKLRTGRFDELKNDLAKAELLIAVATESHVTEFVTGNVDYLESALRGAFDQLVEENIVVQAVAVLDSGIERFAEVLATTRGDLGRIAESLGIRELPQSVDDEETGDS